MDGVVRAIYCRHCNRFCKGKSAHTTASHKGRFRFDYVGPPPPPGTGPGTAPPTAAAPPLVCPPTGGGSPPPVANLGLTTLPNGMQTSDIPGTGTFQDHMADHDARVGAQVTFANYDMGSIQLADNGQVFSYFTDSLNF